MLGFKPQLKSDDHAVLSLSIVEKINDDVEIAVKKGDFQWKVHRKLEEFVAFSEQLQQTYPTAPALVDEKSIQKLAEWLTELLKNSSIARGSQLASFFAQRLEELEADFGSIPEGSELPLHKDTKNGKKIALDAFVLLKVIGKGSFGKVMLVRKKDSKKIYAMKVLQKANVIKRNQVEHTRTEQRIGTYIRHPFIVTLRYAFQTKKKLYLVLDYCPGGELFFHLGRAGRFSENRAKFYAAQIVLALEYLHSKDIVYRDLKPENVLLDKDGYIALTDFGLAKEGIADNVSAHSFCGTPEYLAPEILTRAGHGRAADWWSLGALLYEMLTGMPPFYSRNRDRLFKKILKAELRIPRFFSKHAKALLQGLLCRDPVERLGSQSDGGEIKDHPFFDGIDWAKLAEKKLSAPFVPTITDFTDTTNFDVEFTDMPLFSVSSTPGAGSLLGGSPDSKFAGFTYINPSSAPDSMVIADTEQPFDSGLEGDNDTEDVVRRSAIHPPSSSSASSASSHVSTSSTLLTPSSPTHPTTAPTSSSSPASSSSSSSSSSSNTSPGPKPQKSLLGALLGGLLNDKKPTTNGSK